MCGVRHQDGDYWRQRIDARNGILGRQVPQREAARLRDTLARHGVGAQACCEQLHGARVDGVAPILGAPCEETERLGDATHKHCIDCSVDC